MPTFCIELQRDTAHKACFDGSAINYKFSNMPSRLTLQVFSMGQTGMSGTLSDMLNMLEQLTSAASYKVVNANCKLIKNVKLLKLSCNLHLLSQRVHIDR